ncbi:MAG TPA: glutathione S-transferase family protein, partial [Casimicrobiaceae bacterium]|nr:glutathione S-transferase family protein [Casimicrobiaceae bacterium]
MILVGRYKSPFARRVAITLRHFDIVYEHRPLTAWSHLADVRGFNPVGRVPSLVLDSGEVLFDSTAILDYIDHLVGPARSLVPFEEPDRHEVLRVIACAMGALEKVVAALYERTMHPPEKVHEPWVRHNEDQARSGLAWLDHRPGQRWLALGRLTQADVTTVAAFDFTRLVNPALVSEGTYPRLDALSAHCNSLRAFAETRPTNTVDAT